MSDDDSTCRDFGAYFYLLAMVVIGSSTATAAKIAVRELPVELVPILRFGGAGLTLLPWAWRGGALRRMLREDGPRLLAASAFCVPINQMFFLHGTKLAPTTNVGLIYALCPLVVLGLAVWLGQERFNRDRLAGIILSVAGAIIIALGNFWSSSAQGASFLMGDLLTFGAVGAWGVYLTINKPLINRHGALPVLAGTFLMGVVLFLPIATLASPSWPEQILQASPNAWLAVAYLALVVSVLGLACQNLALRRLDASQVATVGNAAPVLTVLWGVWLLSEPLTPVILVGGLLTLGGIVWSTHTPSEPAALSAEPIPLSGEGESCFESLPTPSYLTRKA